MTILFLGDKLANEARVTDFLEHVATTSLCRFGLMVDRRDVLGPQEADVLIFDEDYCIKRLETFRANLLADPNIKASYNSTLQYPVWTPHLTLGYPATPANPDNRDYPGISWVTFDRVALWNGDYVGTEFRLDDNSYADISYSDLSEMSTEELLTHLDNNSLRKKRMLVAKPPKHSKKIPTKASSPEVHALLSATLAKPVTNAEAEAGRKFMKSLPSGY